MGLVRDRQDRTGHQQTVTFFRQQFFTNGFVSEQKGKFTHLAKAIATVIEVRTEYRNSHIITKAVRGLAISTTLSNANSNHG